MPKLMLQSLKCLKTQDWIGSDECRFEVLIDGNFRPPLRQSFRDQQEWDLNQGFTFHSGVELRLWEEDPLRQEDLIGKATLGGADCDGGEISFNGHGGNYVLRYSVTALAAPETPADDLEATIRAFEQSSAAGVWPNVSKAELIADIRRTVRDPFEVNQASTPLCGPASIVFQLASKTPARYIQMLQSLYETGQFQARTHMIKPSSALVNSRVRKDVTVADWMLMASLRDTENFLFPVEDTSNMFVMGFTKPWEMKGWTFELLDYDRVEWENLAFYGEFEAMRKAQSVVDQGGVVSLLIHSAMLGTPKPAIAFPEHWITFLGNLSIDDSIWQRKGGHIRFDCYSWGQRIHVDLEEKPFQDYTWGVLYGWPA
jgi:hypothetical protein